VVRPINPEISSNARNLVPSQSVPLLLQTFQFLHILTDPTAGPPDFAIRSLISQYLKDTPLPHFADAGTEATSIQLSSYVIDSTSVDVEDPGVKEKSEGACGSEVDELLMHMNLADNVAKVRLISPTEWPFRRRFIVLGVTT
jgi:hypothetical protein